MAENFQNDPMLSLIREWAQAWHGRINTAATLVGGWEVWAQVDMLIQAANSQTLQNYSHSRELLVYGTAERIDVYLTPKTTAPVGTQYRGVELKCATNAEKQTTNFAARLKVDMDYIIAHPALNNPIMYAIGLTRWEVDTANTLFLNKPYTGHVHRERIFNGGHAESDIWMVFIKGQFNGLGQFVYIDA